MDVLLVSRSSSAAVAVEAPPQPCCASRSHAGKDTKEHVAAICAALRPVNAAVTPEAVLAHMAVLWDMDVVVRLRCWWPWRLILATPQSAAPLAPRCLLWGSFGRCALYASRF